MIIKIEPPDVALLEITKQGLEEKTAKEKTNRLWRRRGEYALAAYFAYAPKNYLPAGTIVEYRGTGKTEVDFACRTPEQKRITLNAKTSAPRSDDHLHLFELARVVDGIALQPGRKFRRHANHLAPIFMTRSIVAPFDKETGEATSDKQILAFHAAVRITTFTATFKDKPKPWTDVKTVWVDGAPHYVLYTTGKQLQERFGTLWSTIIPSDWDQHTLEEKARAACAKTEAAYVKACAEVDAKEAAR